MTRSAGVMAVGTILSRLTGLGRLVAMTYALGVVESRLADAYTIANTLPNILYELVLGGVLTSVFVPVLVAELRRSPGRDSTGAAGTLAGTTLAVLAVVSVLAALAAPALIGLFSGRLDGARALHQQELGTYFLRLFAPQIFLYGFAAVAAGILNAHRHFWVPMFAPVLNNLVVIVTFVRFAQITPLTISEDSIAAAGPARFLLAAGTTAGVAMMALAHWPALRRLSGQLRWRVDFGHPAVRRLARLSGWTAGYVVANQISFGIVLYLANGIRGGPTAFALAFAFFQLPYGVVAVSVMTAMFPRLSSEAAAGELVRMASTLSAGLRSMAMVLLPATAVYLVLARPLVTVVLERGVMGAASSALVADVLVAFAAGTLPFAAFLWTLRAFYARQDARTPFVVNVVANVVFVIAAVGLFRPLGVAGLAWAHSLSYLVGAGLAGFKLAQALPAWKPTALVGSLSKMALSAALAAAAMAAVVARAGPEPVVVVGLAGMAGMVVFVVAARLLRLRELGALRMAMRGRE
ncbi:MAG: murein biosynthesis integral membrane protein MurJ [Acidimicrobiales bacterium]